MNSQLQRSNAFLHVAENKKPLLILLVEVRLDHLDAQEVLGDEGVGDEAVLVVRHELHHGLVHALGQDAREDFVVAVEEGDRSVVPRVASIAFFVQHRYIPF